MTCFEPGFPGDEMDDGLGFRCEECGGAVDSQGVSLEESCAYSPEVCRTCHWSPCDGSC